MIQDLTVCHYEYCTTRAFEAVVADFEAAVGTVEGGEWEALFDGVRDGADFTARVTAKLGPSGFTRFLTVDHGAWLTLLGFPAQVRMYTIGNPLIGMTFLPHGIAAGLNVPVRLVIYRDEASGTTRLAYDLPSSLMSGSGNAAALVEAAGKLDAKLAALAEQVTGVTA